MRTLTPKESNILDLDGDLMVWEAELNEAQEKLDWLTSPDYDASQNPDDNCREQDIESLEALIIKAKKNISIITGKMTRLSV